MSVVDAGVVEAHARWTEVLRGFGIPLLIALTAMLPRF